MSFDLYEVRNSDETRTLEVRHPDSGKVLLLIDLLSITADKPTEVRRRQERKRFKGMRLTKIDPVELEQDALEILAACTASWRTPDGEVPTWNKEPLPCNGANARLLYENVKWIRDEVDRFVNDVTNFLQKSLTSGESL